MTPRATSGATVARLESRREGVGSLGKVDSYCDTVPSWHPLRGYFLGLRGSNPWNRLVSASYGMLRLLDYRRLVPRYRVVREVAEKVLGEQ